MRARALWLANTIHAGRMAPSAVSSAILHIQCCSQCNSSDHSRIWCRRTCSPDNSHRHSQRNGFGAKCVYYWCALIAKQFTQTRTPHLQSARCVAASCSRNHRALPRQILIAYLSFTFLSRSKWPPSPCSLFSVWRKPVTVRGNSTEHLASTTTTLMARSARRFQALMASRFSGISLRMSKVALAESYTSG